MAYLFIALLFLFSAFIFSVSATVLTSLEKFGWAIVIFVLTLISYISAIGFGLTWIAWLFGVI